MPILDVQPQLPAIYRLRLGTTEDAVARSGKHYRRPVSLGGKLRATSPVRHVIEDMATSYGGDEVAVWEREPGVIREWETILPSRPIRVLIVPGSSLSQWWELWRSGTCERRCDGVTESLTRTPCLCPPLEERTDRKIHCTPTSRVSLILPRMSTLCVGRLDTGSRIAAAGFAGTVAAAQSLLGEGVLLPAVLRVRERVGKSRYVVPELLLDSERSSVNALVAAESDGMYDDLEHETIGAAVAELESAEHELGEVLYDEMVGGGES